MNNTFSHIIIACNDIEAMIKFYNNVFDADIQFLGREVACGNIGNVKVYLMSSYFLALSNERGRYGFGVVVSNLNSLLRKVGRFGGFQMQKIEYSETGQKYCVVCDPDGNSIEIIEE